MTNAIATCEACSLICATTADVLQLAGAARPEIVLEQVRAAYEAARTTAVECADYSADAARQCADVCSSTSEQLKALIAHLAGATVTVRLR